MQSQAYFCGDSITSGQTVGMCSMAGDGHFLRSSTDVFTLARFRDVQVPANSSEPIKAPSTDQYVRGLLADYKLQLTQTTSRLNEVKKLTGVAQVDLFLCSDPDCNVIADLMYITPASDPNANATLAYGYSRLQETLLGMPVKHITERDALIATLLGLHSGHNWDLNTIRIGNYLATAVDSEQPRCVTILMFVHPWMDAQGWDKLNDNDDNNYNGNADDDKDKDNAANGFHVYEYGRTLHSGTDGGRERMLEGGDWWNGIDNVANPVFKRFRGYLDTGNPIFKLGIGEVIDWRDCDRWGELGWGPVDTDTSASVPAQGMSEALRISWVNVSYQHPTTQRMDRDYWKTTQTELSSSDFSPTVTGAIVSLAMTAAALIATCVGVGDIVDFFQRVFLLNKYTGPVAEVDSKALAKLLTATVFAFSIITPAALEMIDDISVQNENPNGHGSVVRWVEGQAQGFGAYKITAAVSLQYTCSYSSVASAIIYINVALAVGTLGICIFKIAPYEGPKGN
ncbi:hypothetical protein JKP88DRAFT_337874 [Tribonema minus]|uniref:Uncharacterized protein n=1 Tax=Tribonema minus TaxID=303371 RepID=A0A836C8E5_9STRA|nr:hypothetical protein JKP88DRAFT_337874 [Tribonema minus]